MFSGGLGSWMTAKRVADQHGTDDLVLLFADVKGDSTSPHSGEDEDTYRFIIEAAANALDVALPSEMPTADWLTARHLVDAGYVPGLIRVGDAQGRDIWQIFRDDRFLGNSRLANCSKYGKQKPCRDWLDANCDPADTVLYVGLDWSEPHRIPANRLGYAHAFDRPCVDIKACLPFANGVPGAVPCKRHLGERAWRVEFPMTKAPLLDKAQMMALCEAEGIEVPRLYRAGFPHNNCGGGCVRAGQAQFELLLREHPERYRYWEAREQELRDHLDSDVSILRDRTGGTSRPMTLRAFREGIEAQADLFDPLDFGGCGCFTEDVPS